MDVIVGGGVVGLSIAWRLAREGRQVIVVDPAPGRGASYAAAGMLAPVSEVSYTEGPLLRLGVASLRRWPSFAAELAEDAGLTEDLGLTESAGLSGSAGLADAVPSGNAGPFGNAGPTDAAPPGGADSAGSARAGDAGPAGSTRPGGAGSAGGLYQAPGLDLRSEGTLDVAFGADDMAALEEMAAYLEKLGLPVERLTGRECRRLEPMLAPSVRGGLLAPGDAWVNPRRVTAALLAALERRGVPVVRARVTELLREGGQALGNGRPAGEAGAARSGDLATGGHAASGHAASGDIGGGRVSEGGRVIGVRLEAAPLEDYADLPGIRPGPPPDTRPATPPGTRPGAPSDARPRTPSGADPGTPSGGVPREILADRVILAAGAWSAGLAEVPVRPIKGQIMRLRSPQPLLSRCVRGTVHGSPIYLVPRGDGELVVGATQEEMGFDTKVTAGGLYELLRDARELVPGITELEVADVVAGLRPGTPDNLPVIGPSGTPGLTFATGHHRGGVLLAPLTTAILLGEESELAMLCSPGRFREFS